MKEETLYWFFSTLPQVVAALAGLLLTATTFLFSKLDGEVDKDPSLSTIVDEEKKRIHNSAFNLLLITLGAISIDVIGIFISGWLDATAKHFAEGPYAYDILLVIFMLSAICLNVWSLCNLFSLVGKIIAPEFRVSTRDTIAKLIQEEESPKTGGVPPMKFMEQFRVFEQKARLLVADSVESVRKESIRNIVEMLRSDNLLSPSDYDKIVRMIKMRNIYIHGGNIGNVTNETYNDIKEITGHLDVLLEKRSQERNARVLKVFNKWIDTNVGDYKEAYELQQAIRFNHPYGAYSATIDNEVSYVLGPEEKTLRLYGDSARLQFDRLLEERFSKNGLSLEEMNDFDRAMEKDD